MYVHVHEILPLDNTSSRFMGGAQDYRVVLNMNYYQCVDIQTTYHVLQWQLAWAAVCLA